MRRVAPVDKLRVILVALFGVALLGERFRFRIVSGSPPDLSPSKTRHRDAEGLVEVKCSCQHRRFASIKRLGESKLSAKTVILNKQPATANIR
jgi:hypothetical protein